MWTATVTMLRELHEGDTSRGHRARMLMLSFDIVTILYFVVTTFLPESRTLALIDLAIGVILAGELLTRLIADRDRAGFFLRPWNLLDVFIILTLIAPALTGSFVFLRVLRALRVVRTYYVLRELRNRIRFFRANEEVVFSALNLLVFIFVVTAIVYELQVGRNPAIGDYIDALYFTIATLTTTGFGDITLVGSTGRLLAIVIMIVGVSLFLRLAQTIFRPAKVRHGCPDCGLERHDADAIHCKHCGRVLKIETEGA